jgi:eukaryotic-like serine/threonine-protein kinase
MDSILAARMTAELVGREVGGWKATEFLGAGKSALVLKAERNGKEAALKLFDPDLIKKYGEETQLNRISRERRLIGQSHSHLVKIFDGGKCPDTGHLFVTMEYIPAKDLSQLLVAVPHDRIRPLISQLALAARYLHEQELAHRDIKPSNIAVSSDFQQLTLLDLGVLRPFGEVGLTDTEGQHFVGTLQYSSPEFLFRSEQDTPDGWLALAFYQIGAVLHDLLTKKPIFQDFEIPFARMVDAVKHTAPSLEIPGADQDLVALAKACLIKDPKKRLRLVRWESFDPLPPPVSTASIKDRVKRRQASVAPESAEEPVALNGALVLNEMMGLTTTMIRAECLSNGEVFPPVEVHDHPSLNADSIAFRAAFPGATEKGIRAPFALLFRIQLVDRATKIVEVKVGGAVSGDVRDFPCAAFSQQDVIYQGPFGNEKFNTKIEYALYAAVEAAIAAPLLPLGENKPLKIVVPDTAE